MANKKVARNKKSMMNNNSLSGFTIIEVVLVLAIAGLIFMMVFIALPQLQRAQRDTQRGSDVSRLAAAITDYQSNHNGKLPGDSPCTPDRNNEAASVLDSQPTDACKLVRKYLVGGDATNNTFTDPLSGPYHVYISSATGNTAYDAHEVAGEYGTIYMYKSAVCNDDAEEAEHTSNKRDYALVYKRESGGWACRGGSR